MASNLLPQNANAVFAIRDEINDFLLDPTPAQRHSQEVAKYHCENVTEPALAAALRYDEFLSPEGRKADLATLPSLEHAFRDLDLMFFDGRLGRSAVTFYFE